MKRVKRLDFNRLDKATRTPQGFVKAPATFTRVGVFTYMRPDGSIIKEFRPREEVLKEDSLETLKGIPVTNDHPEEMLTAENTKQYQVGYTGDTLEIENDKYINGNVTITDKEAIDLTKIGKVELSCGYDAELDETPGEYEGVQYDVVQRNIIYNHVSVVDRGRAGPNVRLRLDSADAVLIEGEQIPKEEKMEKFKVGDQEFEVSKELKDALDALMVEKSDMAEKYADMEKKMKGMQDKLDAMAKDKEEEEKEDEKGEEEMMDKMQAKIDALEAKLAAQGDFNEKLAARRKVERVASKVLSESKMDSLKSDAEVMRETLKEHYDADFSDKSDAYVEARFDLLGEELAKIEEKQEETSKLFENRFDKDENSSETARKRMIEESRNAWKTKAN